MMKARHAIALALVCWYLMLPLVLEFERARRSNARGRIL